MKNCWESEDRCDDCPAKHPENKCSEYKRVDKSRKNENKEKR